MLRYSFINPVSHDTTATFSAGSLRNTVHGQAVVLFIGLQSLYSQAAKYLIRTVMCEKGNRSVLVHLERLSCATSYNVRSNVDRYKCKAYLQENY